MNNLQYFTIVCLFIICSCKKEDPPIAMFMADKTSINWGGTVKFSDQSQNNPTSWSWTFDGGNPSTSNSQNPSVVYSEMGMYSVKLTVKNDGGSDTKVEEGYITVTEKTPLAMFVADKVTISRDETVKFTDQSQNNPNSWLWIFEGGTPSTSNLQNPSVVYKEVGIYSVILNVQNDGGSDTMVVEDYVTVTEKSPIAMFVADKTLISLGDIVKFTDQSQNNPTTWSWTFEGGTPNTSSIQNPSVTYNQVGVHDVNLYITNDGGSDTKIIQDYITVTEKSPIAMFTADKTSVTEGDIVHFTDNSQNNPTSWNWNFEGGDPSTSTLTNPSVTYNLAGKYSVALEVTNNGGTDNTVIDNYITVSLPLTDIRFYNNTHTDISITIGDITKLIPYSGFATYFDVPGYSVNYYAETSGETTTGTQLGLKIIWDYSIDLNGTLVVYDLNIGPNYYFLYMTNEGTHRLTPIDICTQDLIYGFQIDRSENIVIPTNGIKYSIGYYNSLQYSPNKYIVIGGCWEDVPDTCTYWYQNNDFVLPNTNNQSIHLINPFKKKSFIDDANQFNKSFENFENLFQGQNNIFLLSIIMML